MKILLVNKFLYPKGGAETYVLKLGDMLQRRGHQVAYFGLDNPKNVVGNGANAYVSHLDFGEGIRKNLTAPFRVIYSMVARYKIRLVLEAFQPDVVHLNNIQYHLTPAIIPEIRRYEKNSGRKVRIIATAHDYQLVCPSHGLFDGRGRICEKCLDGHYVHCLVNRCIKNSAAKSFLGVLDGYWWKWNRAYDCIDAVICCSEFLKSMLDTQERFRGKTVAIHNFVDRPPERTEQKEGYVLYFGHLSREKGTLTLLEAARRLPEVRFVFAGFGPAEGEIRKIPNADFVGFKSGKELENLIRRASISVYPSQWYENCPFSVIESQMYGTPVIGSRMGGIPELIAPGRTGELFTAGDGAELEEKIRKVLFTPGLLETYARNCRDQVFETPDSYYEKLMGLYGG